MSARFCKVRRQSDLVSNAQNAFRTLFSSELWSRGTKIKFPPGAGAEITNCGSSFSSFLFIEGLKKFSRKKILVANPVRVKHASRNVKKYQYFTVKNVIFKVSYKIIWGRNRSRSRNQNRISNSDLRLRGAGAETNIFG